MIEVEEKKEIKEKPYNETLNFFIFLTLLGILIFAILILRALILLRAGVS